MQERINLIPANCTEQIKFLEIKIVIQPVGFCQSDIFVVRMINILKLHSY